MQTLDTTHSKFIFISSHSTLIASVYAYYKSFAEHSLMLAIVYLSSIAYWCHPTTGLRRNIDIVLVHVSMLYFYIVSFQCVDATAFRTAHALTTLGAICFLVGLYHFHQGRIREYTLHHMLLHMVGNGGIIVLLSHL